MDHYTLSVIGIIIITLMQGLYMNYKSENRRIHSHGKMGNDYKPHIKRLLPDSTSDDDKLEDAPSPPSQGIKHGRNDSLEYEETYYEFLNNITTYVYDGSWSSKSLKSKTFLNDNGMAYMVLVKSNKTITLSNILNDYSMEVGIMAVDGYYHDISIEFFFNLTLQALPVNKTFENSDSVVINARNISVVSRTWNLIEMLNRTEFNASEIQMEVRHEPQEIKNKLHLNKIAEFSVMQCRIQNREAGLDIMFDFKVIQEEDNSYRVWNYSALISISSIVEIIYVVKLIYQVMNNSHVGKGICLITLCINITWNCIISISHFFLSVYKEEYSYEYGIPFISYFLLFSILELRLLFFAFKARYIELQFNNEARFKRKIAQFYCLFYTFMVGTLMFVKYLYTETVLFFLVFFSTWVFQIIHSARQGSKPPQDLKYFLVVTFNKFFFPVMFTNY